MHMSGPTKQSIRFSDIVDNVKPLHDYVIRKKIVIIRIPKAALNIIASGFSYPTSEDMITASNL